MSCRQFWRRLLAAGPVVALATVALAVPGSAAAATSTHSRPAPHAYHVGHFHAVGSHWTLKVERRDLNGNAEVRHADEFNRAARHGYRYVLVRIRGRLRAPVGGLAYDEKFRLLVDGRTLSPAHVILRHGLPQSGVVNHGQVVTAKVPFLVKRSRLHRRMILRAVSRLDWQSPPRYFRTAH